MHSPLPLFRFTLSLLLILAGTLILTVFLVLLYCCRVPFRYRFVILQWWARLLLFCCGVSVAVFRKQGTTPQKTELLLCNHLSFFDIPILFAAVGKPFRFAADDSVFRTPLFGLYLHLAGCIRVSRTSLRAPLAVVERITAALVRGDSVLVFPEGGINRSGRPLHLGRVHLGFAQAAAATGVPVRLLTLLGTDRVQTRLLARTAPCGCRIGQTAFHVSPEELTAKTMLRHRIGRLHRRAFRALGHSLSGPLAPYARILGSLWHLLSPRAWKALRFRPADTRRVAPDMAVIRSGDGNYYLFLTAAGWIAVDSGYRKSRPERVLPLVGVRPEEVRMVFLTHTDYDHAGGIRHFPHARVFAHAAERPHQERRLARWCGLYHPPRIPAPLEYFDEKTPGLPVVPVLLPGHTAGHCGYLVGERYFCTGDALQLVRDRVRPFFPLLAHDRSGARESVRRAAEKSPGRIICTAHSGFAPAGRLHFPD